MADAIINERLEEAVTRCGELNDEMAETSAAVDAVIEHADELSGKIASEGDDAHRAFEEVASKLEQVEEQLEAAGTEARSKLEALGTAAEETKGKVGELLAKVHAEIEELQARETDLAGQLEGELEQTGTAAADMGEAVGTLQEHIGTHLEEAAAAVDEFGQAILAARNEWEEQKNALLDAVADLDESAAEQATACVAAVEALMEAQRVALVDDLANQSLLEAHNRAVAAVGAKLEEEVPQKVMDALGPLRDAMSALGEMCDESGEGLEERSQQVLAKVQEAIGLMEQLVPRFESANRLG
jgi:chromosome segregation ATPase